MTMTKEQEAAWGQLMQSHYAPGFVKRCAERGLQFQGDDQLKVAMETTAKVKTLQQQANGQGDLISKAAFDLDSRLYGEEKAAEIAQGAAPAVPAGPIPEETKQALAVLLSAAPAEGSDAA